jgi:hypothetical protein
VDECKPLVLGDGTDDDAEDGGELAVGDGEEGKLSGTKEENMKKYEAGLDSCVLSACS